MTISLEGFEIDVPKRIGKYSKFDLFSVMTVGKGKHEGKKVRRERWYDCSLEKAFKEIIRIRLEEDGKQDVSLKEFLKRYEEISNKTQLEINKVNDTLKEIIKQSETR